MSVICRCYLKIHFLAFTVAKSEPKTIIMLFYPDMRSIKQNDMYCRDKIDPSLFFFANEEFFRFLPCSLNKKLLIIKLPCLIAKTGKNTERI